MALNDLIAASGANLYETMRKGFIERPEEARQRGLQELQAEQARLGVLKEQASLDEYQQGSDLRGLQRQEATRKLQPEYIAAQEAQAAKKAKADLDLVTSTLDKTRQQITANQNAEERATDAAKGAEYAEQVLSAVSQATTADAVNYIRNNKQAFLDAGSPEEDQNIETILAAPPEEQDRLVGMLKAASPEIIKHKQKLEELSSKAAGTGGAKQLGTDKQLASYRDMMIANENAGRDKYEGMTQTQISTVQRADRKDAIKVAFDSRAFGLARTIEEKALVIKQAIEAMEMPVSEISRVVGDAKKIIVEKEGSAAGDIFTALFAPLSGTKPDKATVPADATPIGTDPKSGKPVYKIDGKLVHKDGTAWSK